MTKKDYILISGIIAGMPDHAATLRTQKASTARTFAEALKRDNPAFDTSRFLAACKLREEP
jgi:hypothetical protein